MNELEPYLNKIVCADAVELLKKLPDNCIDTCITDPPYGLRFMGKKWDYELPSIELFKEMLRVAKPGTTLMCFGGSRTHHRIMCNIEDAGWEIRDCMMWLYGSGFPKNLDISKAIDKKNNVDPIVVGKSDIKNHDFSKSSGSMMTNTYNKEDQKGLDITKPNSREAKEWEGYGTALKPAWENICVAQKPLDSRTVFLYNWYIIYERISCQLKYFADVVKKDFTLNLVEQKEEYPIAQWVVENNINIQVDLKEVMDILQSDFLTHTSLSIVLLCLKFLKELLNRQNTFTIEMVTNLIIELKTLNLLLSEDTLKTIIQVQDSIELGILQNVTTAENLLKGVFVKLKYIDTLFAHENVISKGKLKNLRPDFEPIIIAMKPIKGNFATNALEHGVAGLNIDAGRIPFEKADREAYEKKELSFDSDHIGHNSTIFIKKYQSIEQTIENPEKGRWPANLLLDEEAAKLLDAPSRFFYIAKPSQAERNVGCEELPKTGKVFNGQSEEESNKLSGSVEDKFTTQPQGNFHTTVKPLKLMEYLCKLTKTPTGGIVLDPFAGSGTTAVACRNTGRDYICCDLDTKYCDIGKKRLSYGPLFE